MLITNIKELFGIHPDSRFLKGEKMSMLPSIQNAFVRIEGEKIVGFGKMEDLNDNHTDEFIIDVKDRLVLPAWCDSHTHLVYAGSRENEFVDKIIYNIHVSPTFDNKLFICTYKNLNTKTKTSDFKSEVFVFYGESKFF